MRLGGAGLLVGAALAVLLALAFATVFLGVIATLRISWPDDHPGRTPSVGHPNPADSSARRRNDGPVTTGQPDHLTLHIDCPPPGEGGIGVRPIVNGRDFLADVPESYDGIGPAYAGVGPRYLFGDDGPLQATGTPHEVRIAWSGCGYEKCCGALYLTVGRDGEHVVWAGWRDPARQDLDLPELRFTVDQYEAEVRRAGADRSWEWTGGVVARLLEAALRRQEDWLVRWDCEVEGVGSSRTEPDRIDVVLRHPRGRDENDQLQFGMVLPITADEPSEQAEHLEAQLIAGDPRAAAEVWGGSPELAERLGYPWPDVHPLLG
ncbi:hypothetical protein [Kitasatospora sp. NPDC056184]|uniref:hypothetical protein n=1 Tax=Kitasatospora sp. NPDC056184 TaxID=3345738 RepID=UPI0035E34FC0